MILTLLPTAGSMIGGGAGGGSSKGCNPHSLSHPAKPTSTTTGTTIAGTRSKRISHSAMAARGYSTLARDSRGFSNSDVRVGRLANRWAEQTEARRAMPNSAGDPGQDALRQK